MSLLEKINSVTKLSYDDIYNTFLGLERRQQMIAASVVAVLLIVILFAPITCVTSKLNEKEEEYKEYVGMASELYAVLGEYSALRGDFSKIEESFGKLGGDSLSRVIYSLAEEIGIKKSNVSLKSVNLSTSDLFEEVGKQATIKNALFDQTIRLLDQLVNYKELPLSIKKLAIKVDPQNKQVMKSVTFTVSTIKPNSVKTEETEGTKGAEETAGTEE